MLKKLMMTTAIGGLLIGSAFAADNSNTTSSPPPAAAQSSPMTPAPAATPKVTQSNDVTTPGSARSAETFSAGSAKFVNSQRQDQYLASKFRGTDVIGSDDKKIGDVSDILFDKDGKIEAYVVGVGGFLGIGSKDVALNPTAFQVVPGDKSKNESDKLRLSMTKDELKNAANFEPYKAPSSTTGMGAATTTTRPLGSVGTPAPTPPAPPK